MSAIFDGYVEAQNQLRLGQKFYELFKSLYSLKTNLNWALTKLEGKTAKQLQADWPGISLEAAEEAVGYVAVFSQYVSKIDSDALTGKIPKEDDVTIQADL